MAEHYLLVAHAQHPLVDGVEHGSEFAARLDAAATAYWGQYEETGVVVPIYVPGSRHRIGDDNDVLALADAGTQYLEDNHDIPRRDLHGEDWNNAFGHLGYRNERIGDDSKRREGVVYCGPDEVRVAVAGLGILRRLKDNANGGLEAFCSPAQVRRLGVSYRGAGLRRQEFAISAVDSGTDVHAGIGEKILTGYTYIDPRWNGSVRLMLRSRMPNDGGGPSSLWRDA